MERFGPGLLPSGWKTATEEKEEVMILVRGITTRYLHSCRMKGGMLSGPVDLACSLSSSIDRQSF